jgi:hypothetical protein
MYVFSERGQICAFGVRVYVVPPMTKLRFCRALYCEEVIFSRPVVLSRVAPVAFL